MNKLNQEWNDRCEYEARVKANEARIWGQNITALLAIISLVSAVIYFTI